MSIGAIHPIGGTKYLATTWAEKKFKIMEEKNERNFEVSSKFRKIPRYYCKKLLNEEELELIWEELNY